MSKTEVEGSRKLDAALFVLGVVLLVVSDAYGYANGNPNKLFDGLGEVLPLLEGSGHSLGTAGLVYGCLAFLNATDMVDRHFSPREKLNLALLISLVQELAGQSIGTVLDIKDVAVIPPTVLFMYYVEVICGRLRSSEIWHKVKDTFTGK